MKAMLLAAGRGERMRPLTNTTPKPLLEVGGKALIEYHLQAVAAAGFTEVVVNVCYFPEQFKERLGNGARYGIKIHYVVESGEPLETGGGILNALPLLGSEPFLAVSADLWTDFPFQTLPRVLSGLAHIVLVPNPAHHLQGDFSISGNRICLEGEKLNFGGIGVYRPELFSHCKPGKFPLAPLLKQAILKNLVSGELYQGQWMNIGTPEQLGAVDISTMLAINP